MILPIVQYGDPVLRQKGERVDPINDDIRRLAEDMLETMRAASGVGLAAQQIGRALQMTVVDVTGAEERPSTLQVKGAEVDPERHMPLVLINPTIKPFGNSVSGPEGCLSFPEIFGDIVRPECVEVQALNEEGQPMEFTCGGLLARAVQHEYDHLQGILFIDRMDRETKHALKLELEVMQAATKARVRQG